MTKPTLSRTNCNTEEFIEYAAPLAAVYYKPGQPPVTHDDVAGWVAVDANTNGLADLTGFGNDKTDKARITHFKREYLDLLSDGDRLSGPIQAISGLWQPVPYQGIVVADTPDKVRAALDLTDAQVEGKRKKQEQYRLVAAEQGLLD